MPAPAASGAAAVLSKDIARSFRWMQAFAAVKGKPTAGSCAAGTAVVNPEDPTKVTLKGRYTNFSLQHIWEKYDYLQTHLLLRECMLSQVAKNPRLLDPEINAGLTPTVFMRVPPETQDPETQAKAAPQKGQAN
ncbi:hypothetical protein TGPRC2_263080 [Toxoplasma gondii TgCatPRC2]|uniref:Uncharacterized protein n=15 Tax=Toxoplasma gondii TaxID=5811 RepID=B9Q0N4_TOXGV|nr:hypothetical protein TGME49_263080 [Toxoplasma gondii ME49]6TMG_T Chain T, ATPTG14 [Toxoplasma gondii GT1]6TMG_t Chain t, ATPTG14 [Toxoplasma gondii GT1]6TMK_T Chain T, ATPTG14 [Toxoplasma gondii GT1]6TMK_t Chain t, ATPTG14 [Toxoplasma gondii GT1]6TML_T7 Chain T7, ATPTG14 [Toxoplasma gondii GT1]6TML_T8 Chain T8, ATPTG14 [Toxoplasma gondii GT1]6TML_T9 Chain T9, ATPTG14 [Toxoplasma gondii GT1]6TML_t7 Chain t7, ATPTG14 [Toxoplasma gondii GT1]6TML_t8 Chain t8, ATPTG14 [Toxoplasma gondii GT1|eukprot:XP_002365408.1 hypothetical protein TGME49_263080 [Toxoplasma gondii ME49]